MGRQSDASPPCESSSFASCLSHFTVAFLFFILGVIACWSWRTDARGPADCFALGGRDCAALMSGGR